MAKQVINRGTVAGDGTGESPFSGMGKANDNFTELYAGQATHDTSIAAAASAAAAAQTTADSKVTSAQAAAVAPVQSVNGQTGAVVVTSIVANYAALPITGTVGITYIASDTGYAYRWTGAAYVGFPFPVDANGDIVANIVPRTDSLNNLLALAGSNGEIASALDSPAIVKFNGVAGGAVMMSSYKTSTNINITSANQALGTIAIKTAQLVVTYSGAGTAGTVTLGAGSIIGQELDVIVADLAQTFSVNGNGLRPGLCARFAWSGTAWINTQSHSVLGSTAYPTALRAYAAYGAKGASGINSIVMGVDAYSLSTAGSSVTIGPSSYSAGQYSVALGSGASIPAGSTGGVAIGFIATTAGLYDVAIGYGSHTTNVNGNSIAIGNAASTSSQLAIAIGQGASAAGTNSISIGSGVVGSAEAPGSVTIGAGNGAAFSPNSMAFVGQAYGPQHSIGLLLGATVSATPLALTTDGLAVAAGNGYWVMGGASVYGTDGCASMRITITGKMAATANCIKMIREVFAVKNGAAHTLVGAVQTIGTDINSGITGTPGVAITVDNATGQVRVTVTGSTQAISWVATIDSTESFV